MSSNETLAFISRIDGWLSSHEGFFLYEAAKEIKEKKKTKNQFIVEIGSWLGKSTICLAAGSQSVKGPKVVAIDPHKGEFTKNNGIGKKSPTFKAFQENLKKAGVFPWVKPLLATSEKAAKQWKGKVSLLFIDGLHDYYHTKQDISLWLPFLKEDGMIAFHDAFCGHEGPEKVVQESILLADSWHGIGVVGSIIYAKKGKPKSMLEKMDNSRNKILISLAMMLNKRKLPANIKFFLIHRVIKFFLLNRYTLSLQLH